MSFFKSKFSTIPNFTQAKLPPQLIDFININYPLSKKGVQKFWLGRKFFQLPENADIENNLRVLKCLAIDAKNHDMEQRLFAMEMKAKRLLNYKNMSVMPNILYGWFSNFGMSILRPSAWLFFLMCLYTIGYQLMSCTTNYLFAFFYSLSNCLPFGGLWRQSEYLFQQLFPCAESWSSVQELTYYSLITFNGLFGFVFIFLIGLGLRNRFRL